MNFEVVEKLGVGSAGEAFLLSNEKVIIIGKREDSFATYKSMFYKMKILEDYSITELKYPKIYELISPCRKYPFGAVVEDYVDGKELRKSIANLNDCQKKKIGEVLAKFITQIHRIKTEDRKQEEIAINLSKYDRSLNILKEFLPSDVYQKLVELKDTYRQLMENKAFCLTHGDLNAGNIMIDKEGKVSGIIDFGNMEYYIPEIEFVHMYFFDKVIYYSMVQNYPKYINENEMIFLELVTNIRHFKNIRNFDERRNDCLNNIKTLLNLYLQFA